MERFTAVTHRHPPFTTRQSRCSGTSLSFYFNELNTEVQFRVVLVGLRRLQHSVQRCCCQDDGANRRGSPYGRCQSGSLRVRHYSPRYCNDFNFNQLALTRGDFRHRGCFCSRKNWQFDRRRRGPFHRQFSGHPPHDVRSRCPLLDLDSLLHHTLVTTIFHCQNGDLSTFHRSGRTILSWTTRAIRQFTAD